MVLEDFQEKSGEGGAKFAEYFRSSRVFVGQAHFLSEKKACIKVKAQAKGGFCIKKNLHAVFEWPFLWIISLANRTWDSLLPFFPNNCC